MLAHKGRHKILNKKQRRKNMTIQEKAQVLEKKRAQLLWDHRNNLTEDFIKNNNYAYAEVLADKYVVVVENHKATIFVIEKEIDSIYKMGGDYYYCFFSKILNKYFSFPTQGDNPCTFFKRGDYLRFKNMSG
jgi:hypothetical protein